MRRLSHLCGSHAKDVRCLGAECIVVLRLGHPLATLLIDQRDDLFGGDAQLIRSISHELAILFVKLGQVVRLLQRQELVDLPQIRDRCPKWARISSQGMKEPLIDDVDHGASYR